MRDGAGDRGETVAKALHLIEENKLHIDRSTVIVADEASMVGTQDLKTLLEVSTAARAKLVLVGDAHQLAPVKARGGMFEQLCDELPWTQRLSEVWRMRDSDERHASLGLRSGRGNRLRKAVGWYRNHDRLHTGDAVAMAADATTAYITRPPRRQGRRDHLRPLGDHRRDQRETAPPLPRRPDAPTVAAARDHQVGAGDIIVSRHNDATITVAPGPEHRRGDRIDQVRNGNRWRVAFVDADGRADRRRAAHRQRPRHLRGRLPPRARHPGLRHHRARRPGHDRRRRPHPRRVLDRVVRPCVSRDGLRRDDPRPRRKPPGHLPRRHQRSRPG